MARVDIKSTSIHGDKTQEERSQIIQQFRQGDIQILIATDITARGIDIPDIEIVINYDLPDIAENYVHRVGRTGRAKHKGWAYSFCAEHEKETLITIQTFLTREIKEIKINKDNYQDTLKIERDRKLDYQSLVDEIESFDHQKRKKKKKK